MESENDNNIEKKKSWIGLTITIALTLLTGIVPILFAWYQIGLDEEQVQEAEKERSKSVKSELVRIVEEHVINQKPLDISRLSRLADFRAREEKLLITPTVSEIVGNAEFNIIRSQYLEFEKKQQFKEIFNGIYVEIYAPDKVSYTGVSENAVNDILASINKGNNKDVSTKIIKLAADFSSKIEELEAKEKTRKKNNFLDLVRTVIGEPGAFALVAILYGITMFYVVYFVRRSRRDKALRSKFTAKAMKEYAREINAFNHAKHKGEFHDDQ